MRLNQKWARTATTARLRPARTPLRGRDRVVDTGIPYEPAGQGPVSVPEARSRMMGGVIMSIPSPDISQFALGPLTIRFYALCLMTGMVVAWWLGRRRWVARGGLADTFEAIALVAIPSGIVGARIYHVVTHW